MNDNASPRFRCMRAVIFDWAGTTVDFGSLAPTNALVELFAQAGVPITVVEARGPMGMNKRDHLRELLANPDVRSRWIANRKAEPTTTDVDALYAAFVPLQEASIVSHATPIPGVVEAVAALRDRGILIGSNTGYNRQLMALLRPAARALGYAPDLVVTSDDTARGRPDPDMALAAASFLGVENPALCVKVDDTPAGIKEGQSAGMWTVGVAVTGNANGHSLESWTQLDEAAQNEIRTKASAELMGAGAHFVIDSVADIVAVVEECERRVQMGLVP